MINTEKSSKEMIFKFHNKVRKDVLKGVLSDQPKARKMPKLKWNELLAEKAKDHVKKCILDSGNLGDLYVGKFDSVGQTVAEHTTIQKADDERPYEKDS
uniref:SCP domain-containing protein n=1 Tax=Schistosoma haematobium TaxID=6185 RepID=A0A094ZFV8_SCHHA